MSDQLTLFAGDTHANRLALPGSEQAQKMTVTSGQKCLDYYRSSGRLGSLVKMLLATSPWDSTKCYLTWKVSATPAKRLLFRLVPSIPITEEIGCGLWQTPVADDAVNRKKGKYNSRGEPKLSAQDLLHTPTATANQAAPAMQKLPGSWFPTPTAANAKQGVNVPDGKRGATLVSAVKAPALWATPMASDYRSGKFSAAGKEKRDSHPRGKPLREQVGGQLNPEWVEWLMGYSIGHTDLEL